MIGIINCDLDTSKQTNGAYLIKRIIPNSKIIDLVNGDSVPFTYKGYIITGSRESYDSNSALLENLRETVQYIGLRKTPCLGICLGMQVIADMYGGLVLSGHGEDGYKKIGFEDKDLLQIPNETYVFHAHNDGVVQAPRDARVLSRSDVCIQAFRLEEFLGVQFHPEISPEVAKIMYSRDGKQLSNIPSGGVYDPRQLVIDFEEYVNGRKSL
jgi:GMP synthase-like glutamine amidotransferase